MSWLLAAAVLVSSPEPPVTPVYTAAAAREIGPQLRTGALLFSKGDCLAIKIFTASPYTHVAAVVVRNGKVFVYESTPRCGVRCLALDEYLAEQGTAALYILQPTRPFTPERCEQFEIHLVSQLGRPYSVRHHLTGQRAAGVHCAEYTTEALIACRMVKAKNPARVSPASLRAGLARDDVYEHTATIQLVSPPEPVPAAVTWYGRMWESTCNCTSRCWRKVRGCVLCY